MKASLTWIKTHKLLTAIIIFLVFLIPIISVHLLFKFYAVNDFWVAEWTAGELLGYIAGFLAFIGTVSLGALALWQNQQIHNQHLETLEPNLSMRLISQNNFLFIAIENTGQIEAKDIQIDLLKIDNNGENYELKPDELFSNTFELYPNEKVQGFIGFNGANICTHTFPKVTLKVKYVRPDINRKKEYTRTLIFDNGFAQKIIADVNVDSSKIENDTDTISRAIVRMANYFDGCQVAPFDKLNILANKSFRNDIVEAVKSKEEIVVLSRTETIEQALSDNNTKEEPQNDQ